MRSTLNGINERRSIIVERLAVFAAKQYCETSYKPGWKVTFQLDDEENCVESADAFFGIISPVGSSG